MVRHHRAENQSVSERRNPARSPHDAGSLRSNIGHFFAVASPCSEAAMSAPIASRSAPIRLSVRETARDRVRTERNAATRSGHNYLNSRTHEHAWERTRTWRGAGERDVGPSTSRRLRALLLDPLDELGEVARLRSLPPALEAAEAVEHGRTVRASPGSWKLGKSPCRKWTQFH